jgi:hypothetical protein
MADPRPENPASRTQEVPAAAPDFWLRAGLAGSFLFLYALMAVVYVAFHRYPAIFQQLGMNELPWLTQMTVDG